MINHSDITIIIPFLNTNEHRLNNLLCVLDSLTNLNIKVILIEQHCETSLELLIKNKYKKINYISHKTKSLIINKSKLVNLAVSNCETEYIWEVDSDIILKWDTILNNANYDDVIKPFNYIVKLDELETKWYLSNKKINIKKGEIKETVNKFGPLSFIIKKEIYLNESGMNEQFEGWSWEDIEFANRIEKNYFVTTIQNSYGIHLWHPPALSNEENNYKILKNLEKTSVKNTINKSLKDLSIFVNETKNWNKIKIISLKNKLSIVIPIKIDSKDRLKNLEIVLNYFKNNFKDFELIVIEQDAIENAKYLVEKFNFNYIFRKNEGCFHKTWNLNFGISIAKNEFILAYDCDALFKPSAIRESLERLISKKTKFIYPYNSYMLEISKNDSTEINKIYLNKLPTCNHNNSHLFKDNNYKILYGDIKYDCTGGALMFSKKDFFICGGYNPNIISYGCEDNEIETRIKKLGYTIERLSNYNCYHLEHNRSTDSHYNNFFENNEKEFQKVMAMDNDILKTYVNNGFKEILFDNKLFLNIENTLTSYSIKINNYNNKIDLTDVDIVIPVFIDTVDRLQNITTLIHYIEKYYVNYKIYLIEMESIACKILYHNKCIEYFQFNEKYFKTKAINLGLSKCNRNIVSIWDVDAIITPSGILDAINSIKNEKFKIAYPYNGWFIDIDGNVLSQFKKDLNVNSFLQFPTDIEENSDYKIRFSTQNRTGGGKNNGGCVFFDRITLNNLGNYNENFFEWGFEDDEIERRFEIMGYVKFNAINSNCYHMAHSRSPQENMNGADYWITNYNEFCKINRFNKIELTEYIKNNFIEKINGVSIIYKNEKIDNLFLQKLIANEKIKNIFIYWDCDIKNNKIMKYDNNFDTIRNTSIVPFIIGQILIYDLLDSNDIDKIIVELQPNRRYQIYKSNEKNLIAFKTQYINSFKFNKLLDFKKIDIYKSKPKCSILFTTWGKDTLRSQEWISRIMDWKTKDYEIIAIIHNETILHRLYMEWCLNKGYIDKLVYADDNHGHINSLALGSSYANSDIIAIINNDILISKLALDESLELLKDEKTGLVGWHYDNITHKGTFWNDNKLTFNLRPNSNEFLEEKEINKIKNAEWFTGKTFNAISGTRRLFLPNGSFLLTKKDLWNKIGGFCFHENDHYFHDDWYAYGILEMGYDIKNLPHWGNSSKPDIFLSKTDYMWRGVEDKSKLVDTINFENLLQDDIILKLICENKCVCKLGEVPKIIESINHIDVKYIDEKADVLLVFDFIKDFSILLNYINDDGYIVTHSKYNNKLELPETYTIVEKNNFYIIRRNIKRERYTNKKISSNLKNNDFNFKINKIDRQKFIILTQPRVGFNNLLLMLNSHSEIRLDYDIFKKNRTAISEVLDNDRINNPNKFLSSYWDLISMETNKKCLGFRFNVWDSPNSVPFENIDPNEYKIILLKRNNIFNSMIDCAFAHNSGIWHTTEKIKSYKPFNIDVKWAEKWIDGVKTTYNSWKNYYDNNNIEYLELNYENLFNDDNRTLTRLMRYIGVVNIKKLNNVFIESDYNQIYKNILNKEELETKIEK